MNILANCVARPMAFALALTLAACSSLPTATVSEIERFDALTFEPQGPRIALIAPDYLDAAPNEAKITLRYWPKGNKAAAATETFTLQRVREPAPPGIDEAMREGEIAAIFKISPKDHDRVRRLQQLYRDQTHDGVSAFESQIEASTKACRLADLPADGMRGSILVKLGASRPYVPLMRDVDIREMSKNAGASAGADIAPCPALRHTSS